MGMKGTCRSANRGGCPLLYAPIYSRTPSLPPVFILLPSWQIFRQAGQKGARTNISLVGFVLPPRNRRQGRAKSKHIFGSGCSKGGACGRLLGCFRGVHWCRLSGFQAFGLVRSSRAVFPALCPFAALRLVHRLEIWLYFAI